MGDGTPVLLPPPGQALILTWASSGGPARLWERGGGITSSGVFIHGPVLPGEDYSPGSPHIPP